MNIIEVARVAGVSKSTVSRVLNKHSNVSPATVDAVMRAVNQLGYKVKLGRRRGRPSKAAAGLRTGTVAMFFPDTDACAMHTTLGVRVTAAVEEALFEQKLSLMLAHLRSSSKLPPCFERGQVDGAIIRAGNLSDKLLKQLNNFPCVWIFQPTNMSVPFDMVMPDNHRIGEIGSQYLIDHGSTAPVVVNFHDEHGGISTRASVAARRLDTVCTSSMAIRGKHCLHELDAALHAGRPPDGLFIPGGDHETFSTLHYLKERGITPGKDLHVAVCVNDASKLQQTAPGAVNIDINAAEIGRSAVELLLWRLANPSASPRRLLIAPSAAF